jgi:hypothetical protein
MFWRKVHALAFAVYALGAWSGIAHAQGAPASESAPSPSASAPSAASAPAPSAAPAPAPSAAPAPEPAAAPAPAPAGAPAPAPAAAPALSAAPAPAPLVEAAVAPVPPTPPVSAPPTRGFVFNPKIGFVLSGSVDDKYSDSYSGATPAGLSPSPSTTSGDEKSGFNLGADFLAAVTPGVRLGAGLLWLPTLKASPKGGSDLGAGNQFVLGAIIEGVIPVGGPLSISLRGQGGPSMLLPGSDLSDQINSEKTYCQGSDTTLGKPNCNINDGPQLGWHIAGGGGFLIDLKGSLRLRFDFLAQYYWQSLWSYSDTHSPVSGRSAYTHDVSYSLSGTRFFLMGGIEM